MDERIAVKNRRKAPLWVVSALLSFTCTVVTIGVFGLRNGAQAQTVEMSCRESRFDVPTDAEKTTRCDGFLRRQGGFNRGSCELLFHRWATKAAPVGESNPLDRPVFLVVTRETTEPEKLCYIQRSGDGFWMGTKYVRGEISKWTALTRNAPEWLPEQTSGRESFSQFVTEDSRRCVAFHKDGPDIFNGFKNDTYGFFCGPVASNAGDRMSIDQMRKTVTFAIRRPAFQ